jgi:hypothetical protein
LGSLLHVLLDVEAVQLPVLYVHNVLPALQSSEAASTVHVSR